ncbi:synaptogyrin isoform X2 [Dermacentor variabilis]|uniref:synaptogyrin isoform X2 n=1 Tax=Dermacentor variabilis TaxID=34621 RepID=UPI003F5B56AE
MNGGAYGAGKAGGGFDPITFALKPQVMLRILCWLFAIVVFGCISSGGWVDERCQYNSDSNACNFGVAVGVLAFLGACGFLAIEAMFESFSSIKIRRRAVVADMAFSGLWAFMWVVCFCYLCDAWRKSDMPSDGYGLNNIRAAIAFSFFSIFTWGHKPAKAGLVLWEEHSSANQCYTAGGLRVPCLPTLPTRRRCTLHAKLRG